MSKRNQRRKDHKRAAVQARQITTGKVLRLFLKTLVFSMVFAVIITVAGAYGLPFTQQFWQQLILMFAIYLLAYPYLMKEFRPKHYQKKTKP